MEKHRQSDNWWYVENLFDYTNRLLERMEQRANFLLISNSVVGASYFSILSFFVDEDNRMLSYINAPAVSDSMWSSLDVVVLFMLLVPALALSASILFSVHTILPVILRADIKLNHGYIAGMTSGQYRDFLAHRQEKGLRVDFIDEVHILSRILDIKSRRVSRAARAFVVAMATMPLVLTFYIGSLFY